MNLGFNEPWTRDVFALSFDKPVKLHRGLPRTDLGFCEPVKVLDLTSLWRINQLHVHPGFWRHSPRVDLRFDELGVSSARDMLLQTCHFLEGHILETWCLSP